MMTRFLSDKTSNIYLGVCLHLEFTPMDVDTLACTQCTCTGSGGSMPHSTVNFHVSFKSS